MLRAAACVLAETGYEATTMCAIAKRAGASIGSLYQFFPNKEAVAEALRAEYIEDVEAIWEMLAKNADKLSVEDLVDQLVCSQTEFVKSHRAFLPLLDAPSTASTWRRRESIRNRIARVLTVRQPGLPRKRALQEGAVVQQIVKGMLTLYARTGAGERAVIAEEFKVVLVGYLRLKFQGVSSPR
ncbi:MAG: TetR/AcrR family transcriptional regulator [Acidobacteriaceae bacterium]